MQKQRRAIGRTEDGAAGGPQPAAGSASRAGLVSTGLLFAFLVFTWGGNYSWVKLGLLDMAPHTLNAVRTTLSVLLLAAVLGAGGGARALLPAPGEGWAMALVGLFQIGLMTVFMVLALERIESARVSLIVYTVPVWILLLSIPVLGESLTPLRAVGVVLGLVGIAILTNPFALSWDSAVLPGSLLALGCTLSWAIGTVLYRRRTWRSGYVQQVFWQLTVTAAVASLFALALEWGRPVDWSDRLIGVIVWNAIGPTALAYWCWAKLMARMSATTASQILLLTPVYAVLQGNLVLGEPIGLEIVLAAGAIVAGAALTFWKPPQ
jgi:drug/metabolite transporter (DMT)-like permease